MIEIKYNQNTIFHTLIPLLAFTPISDVVLETKSQNEQEIIIEQPIDEVFYSLPTQNISINKTENTLIEFLKKISSESKDLDSDIVDMVNENFEDLLLKL